MSIKLAFFDAMNNGYAVDGAVTLNSDGYKSIKHSSGGYVIIDRWLDPPKSSIASSGTTTIFKGVIPVWMMSYGGRYKDEVIPFLRESLSQTYSKNIYSGCRGPKEYIKDNFIYKNKWNGEFENFEGREEILMNGKLAGYHKYFGMKI